MLDVLTASDVRRQDAACESLGIPVQDLMERAGFGVARAVRSALGVTYGLRVVVVCGSGNNGGDGIVAARWLAEWGASATVVLALGEPKGLVAAQLSRFGGRIVPVANLGRELDRADVVIDALFGVGLSRAPNGEAAHAIESINGCAAMVVSVDVPSGIDADTGAAPGAFVRADGVVTLGGLKPALCYAADRFGWIEIADIGVPPQERAGTGVALQDLDVASILPVREPGGHKRRSGTALVVAGSRAMPGAAALTTAACVHAGAGLTTLAATERVCDVALARTPEITTIPLPDAGDGTLDAKSAEPILARAGEFGAIAIGPGLSRHPAAVEAIRAIVLGTAAPIVLDADAINAFAGEAALLRERSGFTVITPHAGEAARLLGREIEDRLSDARSIADTTGAAVLLKGPGTIVVARDGATFFNLTGNRGLAQGGTGDVLTGVIAGLLAQAGPNATSAARLAVVAAGAWLHGRAADVAADRFAPHPSNASMLVDLLPEAIHGVFS